MKERFTYETNGNQGIVTDLENDVHIRFELHKFNDVQEVGYGADCKITRDAMAVARVMREIGDWMSEHHIEDCF